MFTVYVLAKYKYIVDYTIEYNSMNRKLKNKWIFYFLITPNT